MNRVMSSLVLLCSCVAVIHAQQPSKHVQDYTLEWFHGRVVFSSGDTLACKIRYDQSLPSNALQVRDHQNTVTLSAREVKAFSFYDEIKCRQRKFSVMLVENQEPAFFEHLYNDPHFSILNHKTVDVPYDYMNYTRFIARPVIMNKRYILDRKTGERLPLTKENALKVLEDDKEAIHAFIKEHRIKFKKVADFVHLFQYYSAL